MSAPEKARLDGIPAGSVEAVLEILRGEPGPMRRRPLLEALARRGHRISLAGLNRMLEYSRLDGSTTEGPEGVRLAPSPTRAAGRRS